MRWNPRRGKVTSVAYVQPDTKEKSKSPWNSLEVAKIIVGAMTPLLIASIGIYATWQLHQQDVERAQREQIRLRKSAAEPLVHDLQTNTNQIVFAINAADAVLDQQSHVRRKKTADDLKATVGHLQELNSQTRARLQSIIYKDDPSISFTGAELAQTIEIALAVECAESRVNAVNAPRCGMREHSDNIWRCSLAINLALTMFDQLPISADWMDVKGCGMDGLIKPIDPETAKKVRALTAAYAASIAASAASH